MISLAEIQRRIDSGDLSADAAIARSLEAIGTQDKTIGAFVCHDDKVRAAKAGPLRGIAVGIKDIMDTADFRPKWVRRSIGVGGRAAMPRS